MKKEANIHVRTMEAQRGWSGSNIFGLQSLSRSKDAWVLGLLCNNIDFNLACFLCFISLGALDFHSMRHHLIENNCNLFNLRVPQLDPEVTNWTPTDRIYLQLCVRWEAGRRSFVGSKRRSAASPLSRLVVILLGDLVSLGGGKVFTKHYFHTARRQQFEIDQNGWSTKIVYLALFHSSSSML